jgi:hypothetical protein
MRTRPFAYPAPTAEEMTLFLLGRRAEAYRRYWRRTACPYSASWGLGHVFRRHLPSRPVRPTFPRRVGWLGRNRPRRRDVAADPEGECP